MSAAILTCNAGSSSLKAALFDIDNLHLLHRFSADYNEDRPGLRVEGSTDNLEENFPLSSEANSDTAIDALLSWLKQHHELGELVAVGHRVVHGGDDFTGPAWVTDSTMETMDKLTPLALLHQPHNLAPIRRIRHLKPHLPQAACFDTSFHRTMPWEAETYALPQELRDKGVKRYGFHGLSYEYIASMLPEILPEDKRKQVIVAHLGSGCSACALKEGKSVATTMGLTVLDGFMMRTRCGELDPGIPLYLIRAYGYIPGQLEHMLYEDSGLKGIAGGSGDMRDVLSKKTPEAEKAFTLFCAMAARQIAALAADLGGVQAIIFTGGIGARSPEVRQSIMERLAWMPGVIACNLPTNEALTIARHTKCLLQHKEASRDKPRAA